MEELISIYKDNLLTTFFKKNVTWFRVKFGEYDVHSLTIYFNNDTENRIVFTSTMSQEQLFSKINRMVTLNGNNLNIYLNERDIWKLDESV